MSRLFFFLLCAAALTACGRDVGGSVADLRALDQAYVAAWKIDDPAEQERAVLDLFADDAVIMPGGGLEPRRGKNDIRDFWFPQSAPPTRIIEFTRAIAGVEASGDVGVVHGRFALEFEYDGQRTRQDGNYVMIAHRTPRGAWRIALAIWNAKRDQQ